jgi:hypothetical protein
MAKDGFPGRNARPTEPGVYWFHCSRCGALDEVELEAEDILDGCHYGSLMCRACFEKATAHLTKEDVETALRFIEDMNQEQFDAYTEALRKSPGTH